MKMPAKYTAALLLPILFLLLPAIGSAASNPFSWLLPPKTVLNADSLHSLELFRDDATVQRVELLPPKHGSFRQIVVCTVGPEGEASHPFDLDEYCVNLLLASTQDGEGVRAPEDKWIVLSRGRETLGYFQTLKWRGWTVTGIDQSGREVHLPLEKLQQAWTINRTDLRDGHFIPLDQGSGHTVLLPTAWQPLKPGKVRLYMTVFIPSVSVGLARRISLSLLYQPIGTRQQMIATSKIVVLQSEHSSLALGTITAATHTTRTQNIISPTDADFAGRFKPWSEKRWVNGVYAVASRRADRFGVTAGMMMHPKYEGLDEFYANGFSSSNTHIWFGAEYRLLPSVKLVYEKQEELLSGVFPILPFEENRTHFETGGVRLIFSRVSCDIMLLKWRSPYISFGLTL